MGKTPSEERKQQLDKLAELLADIPDYCTVFISAAKLDKRTKLYKFLKSHALLCECEELKPYNAQPWLEKLAENMVPILLMMLKCGYWNIWHL